MGPLRAAALLLLSLPLRVAAPLASSAVHECCSLVDSPLDLLACANTSSRLHREQLFSAGGERGFTLGIVTFSTENIWDYSAYSFAVNEAYAEHNGYVMMHIDPTMMPDRDSYDSRWNKVKVLERALDPDGGWASGLDYIMWVDADLIFLGITSLRIQDVVAEHPEAELIVSAEHAGSTTLINSGSIIVRNSAWSRRFLKDWWAFADRRSYSDQEQFDLLYSASRLREPGFERRIAILPPAAINTDPPAMTMQQPHHQVLTLLLSLSSIHPPIFTFTLALSRRVLSLLCSTRQVLHLMGEHAHFRRRVFRSAFAQLCTSYADASVELPPQLNVTRANLLQWTMEEYSVESRQLYETYVAGVPSGSNSLEATMGLANSVHHYAHAMSFFGQGTEAEALRRRLYSVVRDNIANRRAANAECLERRPAGSRSSECVAFKTDWPEHLKMIAQAGMHLFDSGDLKQRTAAVSEVQLLLQEMLDICHHEQQDAVRLMIAFVHRKNAVLCIEEGRFDDAFDILAAEVMMTRELSVRFGQHLLVPSLENYASLLSMKRRYREAYGLFEECLALAERHVGATHSSLVQPTLNYGIALSRGSGSGASRAMAVAVLQHAAALMAVNEDHFKDSPLHRRLSDELSRLAAGGAGEEL